MSWCLTTFRRLHPIKTAYFRGTKTSATVLLQVAGSPRTAAAAAAQELPPSWASASIGVCAELAPRPGPAVQSKGGRTIATTTTNTLLRVAGSPAVTGGPTSSHGLHSGATGSIGSRSIRTSAVRGSGAARSISSSAGIGMPDAASSGAGAVRSSSSSSSSMLEPLSGRPMEGAPASNSNGPSGSSSSGGGGSGANAGGESGRYEYAARMLREVRRGNLRGASDLFQRWLPGSSRHPVPQQSQAFNAMLVAASRSPDPDLALQLLGAMRARGLWVSHLPHNCVAQALCRAGRHREAVRHVRDDVPPRELDPSVFNVVIEGCLVAGELDLADETWRVMLDRGVRPCALTWGKLMRLALARHDADGVRHAFEEGCAAEEGRSAEGRAQLHTDLVHCLCGLGNLEGAVAALRSIATELLRDQGGGGSAAAAPASTLPTPAAIGEEQVEGDSRPEAAGALGQGGPQPAAQGGAQQQRQQQGQQQHPLADALQRCAAKVIRAAALLEGGESLPHRPGDDTGVASAVWRVLQQAGLAPGREPLHALLQLADRRGGDVEAVSRSVSREMRRAGLLPEDRGYRSLMHVHARRGELPDTLRVWRDMRGQGLQPDVRSFSCLLQAYARRGDVEGADHVLEQMDAAGVEPNSVTYALLFESVKKWGEDVARSCNAAAKLARAAGSKDQTMPSRQRKYRRALHAEKLRRWVLRMRREHVAPTGPLLTMLSHAYGRLHMHDELSQLMEWCLENNLPARNTSPMYVAAISGLARAAPSYPMALKLHQKLLDMGKTPPLPVFNSLIAGAALHNGDDIAHLPPQHHHHQQHQPPQPQPQPPQQQLPLGWGGSGPGQGGPATRQRPGGGGGPKHARKLWDELLSLGLQPDVYTYNAMVKCEAFCGELDRAMERVEGMASRGVPPDDVTFRTLRDAAQCLPRAGERRVALLRVQQLRGRLRHQQKGGWEQPE